VSLPRTVRSPRNFLAILPSASLTVANLAPLFLLTRGFAEDPPERKIRVKVLPVYPAIARKMGLSGVVRVQVVISPSGSVKETKVIGGHPILVTAAVDAVKKWKFDPASAETTGTLEIKFDPGN